MVEIAHVLLINTGVSSVVLFLLLLFWNRKPSSKKEERVYLSKDMHKIKQYISDVEDI